MLRLLSFLAQTRIQHCTCAANLTFKPNTGNSSCALEIYQHARTLPLHEKSGGGGGHALRGVCADVSREMQRGCDLLLCALDRDMLRDDARRSTFACLLFQARAAHLILVSGSFLQSLPFSHVPVSKMSLCACLSVAELLFIPICVCVCVCVCV